MKKKMTKADTVLPPGKPKPKKVKCPNCGGSGRIGGNNCGRCNGTGEIDLING